MATVSAWSLICRNRRFRRLWLAQLISFAGDFINQVALSSLIYQLTGKATMVAALALVTNLPMFLASLWAGVLADRLDRISIMVACDVVRAGLILGLLLVRDAAHIPLALLIMALVETFSAFFEPASAAALPAQVSADELPAAVALSSASWSTMLAVGAALGGLLTTHWGSQAAFLANSASFLISAALLWGLHHPPAESQSVPVRPWQDLCDGLQHVTSQPRLVALLLVKVTFGLGTGILGLLTVLPLQVFQTGEGGVGTLFSARGTGAVAGPFLAQRWAHKSLTGRVRLIGLGLILTGFFYILVARAADLYTCALWVLLAHVGSSIQWVLSTTLLQQCCQEEFRGRVMAFDFAGVTLSMALSTLVFGFLIDDYGARQAGFAGSLFLGCLGIWWSLTFGWVQARKLWGESTRPGGLDKTTAIDHQEETV